MKTSYFNINTFLLLSFDFISNHRWIDAEDVFANYGFNTPPCNDTTIKYNVKQKLNDFTHRFEKNNNWNYQLWVLIVQNSLQPIYIKLNKYDLKTALIDFARQVEPLKLSCSQRRNSTTWNETTLHLPLGCVHIDSQFGTKAVRIKVHELFAVNLTFVEFNTMGDDLDCSEITRLKILLRLRSNSEFCYSRYLPDLCGRRQPLDILLKHNDIAIIIIQTYIWAAYYIRFIYQVIDFNSLIKNNWINYKSRIAGNGTRNNIGLILPSGKSK